MPEHTILLVEDEPNSVTLFQYAAAKLNITDPLQVARDGAEAIDYCEGVGRFADREMFPLPGLVVLDLRLPRATGFEVLQAIRSSPSLDKMVVIMFTASSSLEDMATACEMGANAYAVKPSTLHELVDIVGSMRNFWLLLNSASPLRDEQIAARL